jgi:hypothetical protein
MCDGEAVVIRACTVAILIILNCPLCSAETRWCPDTATVSMDKVRYPPIGRAAHITGVVLSRLFFTPSGEVMRVDDVSGPVILAKSMNDQLKKWTVNKVSDAVEPCQILVVTHFTLGDADSSSSSTYPAFPNIFRVQIHAEELVISDPAAVLGKRRRWFRWW